MKSKYFCIVSLLFFAIGVYANDYLIVMDNLTEQGKKDFFVIDYVRNHFIVIANDNDLAQMNTRNFSYRILDNDPKTKDYYLVYPIFESNQAVLNKYDEKTFEKYGRVIKIFEKCLLIQTSIDNLQRITEYRVKLNYLEMDKLSFETEVDPEIMAIHKRPVQISKYITDMLGRFENTGADSADSCLRNCVAFHNRFADAKYMRDEVNPWLKEKFKAYGCDSIIETPVSGLAPVISGVRYGKKNPGLLNGYVSIMGGHTDNKLKDSNSESRHQGAWDGGSQTVGYLEACRLLQYYTFENTIVFSSFCGEEFGFKGATALLKAFKAAGVKSICGWNYDMIGWGGSVRLSTGEVAGSSGQATKVRSLYTTYELSKYVRMTKEDPATVEEWQKRGTDLAAFNKQGYLACQLMGGGGSGIHTAADTINKNYTGEKMAAACIIGAVTLMEYAVPIGLTNTEPNNVSYTNNHNFSIQNMNGIVFIRYSSGDQVTLSITIYNPIGKAVATITPEKVSQNSFIARWKYNTIAEGIYILNCKTSKGILSEKILVSR